VKAKVKNGKNSATGLRFFSYLFVGAVCGFVRCKREAGAVGIKKTSANTKEGSDDSDFSA